MSSNRQTLQRYCPVSTRMSGTWGPRYESKRLASTFNETHNLWTWSSPFFWESSTMMGLEEGPWARWFWLVFFKLPMDSTRWSLRLPGRWKKAMKLSLRVASARQFLLNTQRSNAIQVWSSSLCQVADSLGLVSTLSQRDWAVVVGWGMVGPLFVTVQYSHFNASIHLWTLQLIKSFSQLLSRS